MSARYFVILATGRTGSNALCFGLNRHPEIECAGEIFGAQELRILGHRCSASSETFNDRVCFRVVNILRSICPTLYVRLSFGSEKPWRGFKVMPHQFALFQKLRLPGVVYFYLEREDARDQALSLLRAEKTNCWHLHKNQVRQQDEVTVHRFTEAQIAEKLQLLSWHRNACRDAAERVGATRLTYSEVSDLSAFEKVTQQLGCASVRLEHVVRKIGGYAKASS